MKKKRYLDYEGLQELVLKIKEFVGDAGKLEFKGTVIDVAHLPSVAAQKIGYMYTVQAAGVTTAEFVEGPNLKVAANSEVAAVEINGTSENTIYSVDAGVSYVTADLQAYTPTGTLSAATKLASAYVADGTETHLTDGTLYVTEDGTTFYSVTALAETFADFIKVAIDDEDVIAELGTLYTGDSFKDLNAYTETITGSVMMWCLLGPVFDVSDKLTFTTTTMPVGTDGLVIMYLGETTYTYEEVEDPDPEANPKALGWYVSNGSGGYVLTEDETVQDGTTYYTKEEQYVQGVVYQYSESEGKYLPLSSGDTFTPITNQEIDALFE